MRTPWDGDIRREVGPSASLPSTDCPSIRPSPSRKRRPHWRISLWWTSRSRDRAIISIRRRRWRRIRRCTRRCYGDSRGRCWMCQRRRRMSTGGDIWRPFWRRGRRSNRNNNNNINHNLSNTTPTMTFIWKLISLPRALLSFLFFIETATFRKERSFYLRNDHLPSHYSVICMIYELYCIFFCLCEKLYYNWHLLFVSTIVKCDLCFIKLVCDSKIFVLLYVFSKCTTQFFPHPTESSTVCKVDVMCIL